MATRSTGIKIGTRGPGLPVLKLEPGDQVSQYLTFKNDLESIKILLDYTLKRHYPELLKLTDEKENLIRSSTITAPQRRVVFSNLQPKKYYVRLIIDENNNGKWDSGRFLKRSFPEKVFHYEPVLDVRANWEIQEQIWLD